MKTIVEYKQDDGEWQEYAEAESEHEASEIIRDAKAFDTRHQIEHRQYRVTTTREIVKEGE